MELELNFNGPEDEEEEEVWPPSLNNYDWVDVNLEGEEDGDDPQEETNIEPAG